MKTTGICALLAAFVISFSAADADAFGRRYIGSSGYYGHGPAFYYGPILDQYGLDYYGGGYYDNPYYFNPYIAPYPAYGIMPPPFATKQIVDSWSGRRPSDYGYPYGGGRPTMPTGQQAIPYQDAPPPVDPKVEASRATIVVHVPTDNAVVLFDGKKTTKTGKTRTFRSPPLVEDRLYSYKITATWVDDGKEQTDTKEVQFVAGEKTRPVTFEAKKKESKEPTKK